MTTKITRAQSNAIAEVISDLTAIDAAIARIRARNAQLNGPRWAGIGHIETHPIVSTLRMEQGGVERFIKLAPGVEMLVLEEMRRIYTEKLAALGFELEPGG